MATDGITLLKNDHRTVEDLFARFEGATTPTQRRLVVEEIVRELSIHAAIEEQFLYPAVSEALPDGEQLAEEALREHKEVKEVLSDLDGMDPLDPRYDAKVRALITDVNHHVQEEESEMLPRFRRALTGKRLREMGEAMEVAKNVAPTRPHPKAPDTPPANLVTGLAAAAVDRTRDAARDVGRRAVGAPRKVTAKKAATKRTSSKRSTAKRPATRKTATKRSTTKRTGARRPAAKRSAAKRSTAKKSTAKRSTAKRSTAKKRPVKRATAKRTTTTRSTAKRPATRKRATKRSTAKKTTARRRPAA